MPNHRVLKYQASAYHTSTGSTDSGIYPFLPEHATQVNTTLHAYGIDITKAIELINRWNNQGRSSSIIYRYSIALLSSKDYDAYLSAKCYSK
jgi:hypothetical protein